MYCEMLACNVKISEINFKPKGWFMIILFSQSIKLLQLITNKIQHLGIILSGGPYSVYDKDAPHLDPAIWELGVPVLGICYGLQEIAHNRGGKVVACEHREYGHATLEILHGESNALFKDVGKDMTVWMSHGDQLSQVPEGFRVIGKTKTAPFAAIDKLDQRVFGIQFHPEVTHTKNGTMLLKNFVVGICECSTNWSMTSFIDKEIARIRAVVGPDAHVIGAVSGGVDSTVAAVLMTKAVGSRFHAVLVDNGVMRLNECEQVKATLKKQLGINLTVVDAADLFLGRLKGVTDPEKKRKIIGNTFVEVFEQKGEEIEKMAEKEGHKIEFLLQGTLYPDVIESISFKGPSATIKTHHNVGGLLADMKLKLIEPLRELFKDEVRALGSLLNIPDDLVCRHPFPGPGIAIRILGEVTPAQVTIARHADAIFIEEIKKAGLYRQISQAYAALLPIRSVGVMGDKRTYEQVIALRAVETTDFMTADWFAMPTDVLKRISSRIINEVKGVNRVVYDVSSKPPATIEWE